MEQVHSWDFLTWLHDWAQDASVVDLLHIAPAELIAEAFEANTSSVKFYSSWEISKPMGPLSVDLRRKTRSGSLEGDMLDENHTQHLRRPRMSSMAHSWLLMRYSKQC